MKRNKIKMKNFEAKVIENTNAFNHEVKKSENLCDKLILFY